MGQMPPQGMPQGNNLMAGPQGMLKPNFFPNAPGQLQSMGHPSINMQGLQNFPQNQMGLQNQMGNMPMGGNGIPPPFLPDGQNPQTHQPNVQFNPMPGVGMDHRFMPNFGPNLTQINSQAMIQGGQQARFFNPSMTITNPNEGNGDMKMNHNFPVNSNNSQPRSNPDLKNNYLGIPPPLKHATENRSDSKSRNKKSSRRADKYSSNSSISRSPSQNRHSKTNKSRGQNSRNHRNSNKGLQTISEEGKSNRHSDRRSSVSRSRSRNDEIGRNGKDKRGSDPRGKTGNHNSGNGKNPNGRNQSQNNQNNQNNQNSQNNQNNQNNQNHQKSNNKNNKNAKNNDNNNLSKNAKNKPKKNEKNTPKYDQPKKHPSDDDRIRNSDSKGGSGESGDKKPDQAKILELLGRIKGKENNSKKAPASKGDALPEHDTDKKEKSTGSLSDDKNPKVEPKKKCQSLGSVNSGQSEKSKNGHAALVLEDANLDKTKLDILNEKFARIFNNKEHGNLFKGNLNVNDIYEKNAALSDTSKEIKASPMKAKPTGVLQMCLSTHSSGKKNRNPKASIGSKFSGKSRDSAGPAKLSENGSKNIDNFYDYDFGYKDEPELLYQKNKKANRDDLSVSEIFSNVSCSDAENFDVNDNADS